MIHRILNLSRRDFLKARAAWPSAFIFRNRWRSRDREEP